MATGHVARQVFDLPAPQALIVTEHRAHGCRCVACGVQTRAAFPEGVSAPVQYGERISAFVLYLLHYQLLPEKRLAALMADLFGVKLVTATIARFSQDCAQRFQVFADAVRDRVAAAPVKHMDETGFRIGGKTQWLHIASTIWLTFYRVSAGAGQSAAAKVTGIVVHDHWKPYYTMTGVLHALWQRAPSAGTKGAGGDRRKRIGRIRCSALAAPSLPRDEPCARAGCAADAGSDRTFDRAQLRRRSSRQVWSSTRHSPRWAKARRRGRPPRRVGHNLLLRLSTRKSVVLRFLSDPAVPFTNNLAEQDGRMMKLRGSKFPGGFRSEDGARILPSSVQCSRRPESRGWNMLRTLTGDPVRLTADIRLA